MLAVIVLNDGNAYVVIYNHTACGASICLQLQALWHPLGHAPYSQSIHLYLSTKVGRSINILPSSFHVELVLNCTSSLTLWTWLAAAANPLRWESGVSPTFLAFSKPPLQQKLFRSPSAVMNIAASKRAKAEVGKGCRLLCQGSCIRKAWGGQAAWLAPRANIIQLSIASWFCFRDAERYWLTNIPYSLISLSL